MEGIDTVAQLMAMAAITAPKTAGKNFVQVKLLQGEQVQQLGQAMIAFGKKSRKVNFDRDGQNVLDSECVVLIGIQDAAHAFAHHLVIIDHHYRNGQFVGICNRVVRHFILTHLQHEHSPLSCGAGS